MKRTSLPVLALVAVLAMLLGSLGTAVAKPALTAGKVKKIAAKVVKKQAPQLTVARAAQADSATTANTATTAGNATKLDGAGSNEYRVYATQAESVGPSSVGTSADDYGTEGIQVPAGHLYVLLTGSASFTGGNTTVDVWPQLGAGACVTSGPTYDLRQTGHTANPTSVAFSQLVPVTTGIHLFTLCARAGGAGVSMGARTIVAQTVNFAGD